MSGLGPFISAKTDHLCGGSAAALVEAQPLEAPVNLARLRSQLGVQDLESQVTEYFEGLREPLFRYLVGSFGNPAEAEEIVQEAFLRLYRSLHTGDKISNVRSWVFRVAHNLALDWQKAKLPFGTADSPAWDDLGRINVASEPDPEQAFLELEQARHLLQAMQRLTAHERRCLHLRAEGLRHREIAVIIGVSSSTVSDSLQRAIRKLMREVGRSA